MRKIILSICLLLTAVVVSAQLTVTDSKCIPITEYIGSDTITVFIFNGLTKAKVDYSGSPTNVEWYQYPNTFMAGGVDTFDNLTNNTGYYLQEANGHKIYFWVIDYKNYLPSFTSLEAENNPGAQCKNLKLLLSGNVPELSYQTIAGVRHVLPRNFTLNYKTKSWASDNWTPPIDTTVTVTLPSAEIYIPSAPLCDTEFTLSGDQFTADPDLGLNPVSITSPLYSAVAVKCHPTSIVTTRDDLNEQDRPTQSTQLSGSAPLDIQFLSNANEPVALYYNWEIYKDKQLLISRSEKDHRYTFTQAGDYKVKLTTSNAYCSDSDSIIIKVSESAIYVPNVFTPNGDGKNDEFRIAYKSIISFHCWVYNRWGRLVYEWSDPTKGWNGNINGREASPSAYFYIIKAVGSDGKRYKLKGDINLLR